MCRHRPSFVWILLPIQRLPLGEDAEECGDPCSLRVGTHTSQSTGHRPGERGEVLDMIVVAATEFHRLVLYRDGHHGVAASNREVEVNGRPAMRGRRVRLVGRRAAARIVPWSELQKVENLGMWNNNNNSNSKNSNNSNNNKADPAQVHEHMGMEWQHRCVQVVFRQDCPADLEISIESQATSLHRKTVSTAVRLSMRKSRPRAHDGPDAWYFCHFNDWLSGQLMVALRVRVHALSRTALSRSGCVTAHELSTAP